MTSSASSGGSGRYLRPNGFFRRVLIPLFLKLGLTPELAVRGRRSGEWRSVPVNVLNFQGSRYLVAPRGHTEWVRNLRQAGGGEIRRKGVIEPFRAHEVAIGERTPMIEAYLAKWGWQVAAQFKELPDPSDHPVFRIEPTRD